MDIEFIIRRFNNGMQIVSFQLTNGLKIMDSLFNKSHLLGKIVLESTLYPKDDDGSPHPIHNAELQNIPFTTATKELVKHVSDSLKSHL